MSLLGLISTLQPWKEPGEYMLDFSQGLPAGVTALRDTEGYYMGPDGLLVRADINKPRFEHDPMTGAFRGYLMERSATNLNLSHRGIGAGWFKGYRYFWASNAEIAPDGTRTATHYGPVTGETSFTNDCPRTEISMTPGWYTISGYFKAIGTTTFLRWLPFIQDTNGTFGGLVDLRPGPTMGEMTGFTNNAASAGYLDSAWDIVVTPMQNGWLRIAVSVNVLQNVVFLHRSFPYIGSSQVTGDNYSGLLSWGIQVEKRRGASSPILTVGSTLSRAADSWTTEDISALLKPDQGTLFFEGEGTQPDVTDYYVMASNVVAGLQDSYMIWNNSPRGYLNAGGSTSQTTSVVIPGGGKSYFRSAYGYTSGSQAISSNGLSPGTGAAAGVVTAPLRYLRSHGEQSLLIRRIAYYPRRFTNAELQNLTRL